MIVNISGPALKNTHIVFWLVPIEVFSHFVCFDRIVVIVEISEKFKHVFVKLVVIWFNIENKLPYNFVVFEFLCVLHFCANKIHEYHIVLLRVIIKHDILQKIAFLFICMWSIIKRDFVKLFWYANNIVNVCLWKVL